MKVLEWLKSNLGGIILGAAVVGIIAGIAWPSREAKLQDGKEVAVETKISKYTAEFLYDELKNKNGLTILLSNVDKDIINDKYGTSLDAAAKASATEEAESYIKQYNLYYGMDEATFLSQNGFKSKDEFIEQLMITYKINHYVDEYVTGSISESELKEWYNKNVFGDMKITLISSSSNEADVKKAQKELKSGKEISKVKSKYTNLVYNDLDVTFDTYDSFASVIINTIKNMNAKQVSDVVKDDTYGYLAIYVSGVKQKPSYEDSVGLIKKILSKSKQGEDETLYYKALMQLRNEYNIKFNDAKYEEYYKNFNKQYASQ